MRCCIVGIGKHASENLIPALQRLQTEGLIKLTHLCREHVEKGDGGLGLPTTKEFPKDVDFMVVCGHPHLHKKAINFSNITGIPVFVEKPHIIENQYVNDSIMIGYNYNFIPAVPDSIDGISCGAKGVYRSWPDIFHDKNEIYYHAFHSMIVHPISIIVQRHGSPNDVNIINDSKDDDLELKIELIYSDKTRTINFSSKYDKFSLDITSGEKITSCRQFKSESYYNMLKYYVNSKFSPLINNAKTGKDVLSVVTKCLNLL
jgi:hypothetical protein